MRLVDVADIEKFISEKVTAAGDDHILLVAGDDGRWHEALPFIKTAYDVDKVVEQLNKIKKYNLNLTDMMLDIQRNGTNRHFICLEDAIEIVRQGGVFNDVCEWKKSKDYPFDWFVGCDGCEVNHKQGDYCPRCGKKIKVVE